MTGMLLQWLSFVPLHACRRNDAPPKLRFPNHPVDGAVHANQGCNMNTIDLDQKFKTWAQLGYSARGVIYLVIGGLALLAALGERGGQTTNSKGAILKILE
jgi:hypothetical protein